MLRPGQTNSRCRSGGINESSPFSSRGWKRRLSSARTLHPREMSSWSSDEKADRHPLGILATCGNADSQTPQFPGGRVLALWELVSELVDERLGQLDLQLVDRLADILGLLPPDSLNLGQTGEDGVPHEVFLLVAHLVDEAKSARSLARSGAAEGHGVADKADTVLDGECRVGLGSLLAKESKALGRVCNAVYVRTSASSLDYGRRDHSQTPTVSAFNLNVLAPPRSRVFSRPSSTAL